MLRAGTVAHVARDRRAGRARHRRDRRLPPAAGRDLLDRQRNRRARQSAAPGRRLRLQRRDHRRGGRGTGRHARASRRHSRRRGRAGERARAGPRSPTSSCSRAARPRARAISPIASVHGLRNPGVVAHGVALKPGKPICLAVTDGKPVVILPGFPTSAIFTFHEFVAPVMRAYAGLPRSAGKRVAATLPMRVNSERGRTEYLLVGLVQGQHGLAAYPMGKGSGSVTTFSGADGFITIDQHTEILDAGSRGRGAAARPAARARRPRHHRQPLRRPRPARSAS